MARKSEAFLHLFFDAQKNLGCKLYGDNDILQSILFLVAIFYYREEQRAPSAKG